MINTVCLLIVPVKQIDAAGDKGKHNNQDIIGTVLAVSIEHRIEILHIHIPEINAVNSAGNKIQKQKRQKIPVVLYIHFFRPLDQNTFQHIKKPLL